MIEAVGLSEISSLNRFHAFGQYIYTYCLSGLNKAVDMQSECGP